MAARTTRVRHSDDVRLKIKTSMILNRLHKHIETEGGIMSASQVKAAEILLRKTIPDLKSIEHSGANGGPLDLKIILAPFASANEQPVNGDT